MIISAVNAAVLMGFLKLIFIPSVFILSHGKDQDEGDNERVNN